MRNLLDQETIVQAVEDSVVERRLARRFFNRTALIYPVIGRRSVPAYRRVLRELSFPAELTILDIGTGTGSLAGVFADRGHRVTGVDSADQLIATARRRVPSGDFRVMDLVELGEMAPDSFDIVCLAHVLHGLNPDLREVALHIAARLAREGVLVFDYSGPGPWYVRLVEWIEGPHYTSFLARGLVDLASAHRLVIKEHGETSSFGGWWWCVEAG